MKITVSAPGKIILIGEHSVVYGKPALLAAVDRRVKVILTSEVKSKKLKVKNDNVEFKNSIEIKDKNLNISETIRLEKILEFTKWAREKWEEYRKSGDTALLREITDDKLALVKIAIGEVLCHCEPSGARLAMTGENITLEVASDIPVGRGMGSSAAIAVAVTEAVLFYCHSGRSESGDPESRWIPGQARNDIVLDLDLIFKIALEVEKRVHGNPSGADVAIATYGGFLWYRRETEDLRVIKPVNLDKKVFDNFTVIDTGKPVETTGEMVAIAGKKIKARPRWGKEILEKMEADTKDFYNSLIQPTPSLRLAKEAIFSYERCLEKLGVVSESTKLFIRRLKVLGVAAKVSGAGGSKGNSGMVLCFGDKERIRDLAKRSGYAVLSVTFGGNGIQIED